jgi:hypothetical protein
MKKGINKHKWYCGIKNGQQGKQIFHTRFSESEFFKIGSVKIHMSNTYNQRTDLIKNKLIQIVV